MTEMLNVFYGEVSEKLRDKYIFNPKIYFNNTYKDKWIAKPRSVEMIRDNITEDRFQASLRFAKGRYKNNLHLWLCVYREKVLILKDT